MYLPCSCSCENICDYIGPIVWGRVGTGYRIETLQRNNFKFAIDLITQYYFKNDVLCKATDFQNDFKSVANFCNHLNEIMTDGACLSLIEEQTDSLVGVLLLSVVNKLDFGKVVSYSNMKRGEIYEKCIELKNIMQKKVDFFLNYDTESLLRFYLMCIADEHRGKQLGYYLYRSAIEVARHLCIPIACGVFNSEQDQVLAKRLGFEIVDSLNYDDWLDDDGKALIQETDKSNSIALMVARIPKFYITPIVYGRTSKIKNTKESKPKVAKNK